jgi:hypothetical protein
MKSTTSSVASRYIIGLILFVFLSGCARAPDWSDDEKKNVNHFYVSDNADREATSLVNSTLNGRVSPATIEHILRLKKTALSHARQLKDTVLDKAHPEMREPYRQLYQRSLELQITSIEQNDAKPGITGSILHDQWIDWFNDHNRKIKIP